MECRHIRMKLERYYATEIRARNPNDVLHSLCRTANFATNVKALAIIFKLYMQDFLQGGTLVFITRRKFFRQEDRTIGKTTLTKSQRSFILD